MPEVSLAERINFANQRLGSQFCTNEEKTQAYILLTLAELLKATLVTTPKKTSSLTKRKKVSQ